MRALLIFAPALLLAQTTPNTPVSAPKSATAKPRSGKPAAVSHGTTKPAAKLTPVTDEEKTIYALGLSVYRSLSQFDLSPKEVELIRQAIADAADGTPAEDINTWGPKIQGLSEVRASRAAERQRTASQAYLEKAATETGAVRTDSGLIYREVRAGTGATPKSTDTVKVNYRGTLVDGKEFDSSYSRNEPAQFELNKVIPCWIEGLQRMKVGGKATLVCPAQLAYGEQGRPSIPGGAALVFDIELLDIVNSPPGP